MASKYFDGDSLTDEAILTTDLMSECTITTTNARTIPKTLNLKETDKYDYMTKNIRVGYPGGSAPSGTTIIPNVVLHHDTFDNFGKTGVYIGVPQAWVQQLAVKIISSGSRPLFEDTGLASDDSYWWTRCGFNPAEKDKEYIVIGDENDDGEIEELPFASFPDLFNFTKTSVVANVTTSIKMTAKIPVEKKGAASATDEWRMGLSITKVAVYDLTDVNKPKNSTKVNSITGKKDKARGKLAIMMKGLQVQD